MTRRFLAPIVASAGIERCWEIGLRWNDDIDALAKRIRCVKQCIRLRRPCRNEGILLRILICDRVELVIITPELFRVLIIIDGLVIRE